MQHQDTERTTNTSRSCEACGVSLADKPRSRRFCSAACYQQWWTEHRQREMSQKGTQRLIELLGTPEGDQFRQRIAESNRHRPRRRRSSKLASSPSVTRREDAHEHDAEHDDEVIWAQRGDYWEHASITPLHTQRRGKSAVPESLILTGHGVQFRIQQGTLVISNGLTHYPQHRQEWRFFPDDRALPSRIIVLDADGSISLHVVSWLVQQHPAGAARLAGAGRQRAERRRQSAGPRTPAEATGRPIRQ